MSDQYLQLTTEIVIKMMELNKIQFYADPVDPAKENENYVKELSKVFKAVYQTVTNPRD